MGVFSGKRPVDGPGSVVGYAPSDDELTLAVQQLTSAKSWRRLMVTQPQPFSSCIHLRRALHGVRSSIRGNHWVSRDFC